MVFVSASSPELIEYDMIWLIYDIIIRYGIILLYMFVDVYIYCMYMYIYFFKYTQYRNSDWYILYLNRLLFVGKRVGLDSNWTFESEILEPYRQQDLSSMTLRKQLSGHTSILRKILNYLKMDIYTFHQNCCVDCYKFMYIITHVYKYQHIYWY